MQILKQQFTEVIPSKVVHLGTINFYPIYFKFKNIASNLISLDELFDRKLLCINEVNFDGSVGQVEVANDEKTREVIVNSVLEVKMDDEKYRGKKVTTTSLNQLRMLLYIYIGFFLIK